MKEMCKKKFSTHQATLIQNTDRFLIIEWKRADGSGDYYVNYIVDKKRGSLIVSGDLGDSIATWYNPIKICNLKNYVLDIEYYASKFQCSSDKYKFDPEDILADIKEQATSLDFRIDDEQEFWENVESAIYDGGYNKDFIPSQELTDLVSEIDCDYFEWLYTCGRKIHIRVYLWAVGFNMACEQLGF